MPLNLLTYLYNIRRALINIPNSIPNLPAPSNIPAMVTQAWTCFDPVGPWSENRRTWTAWHLRVQKACRCLWHLVAVASSMRVISCHGLISTKKHKVTISARSPSSFSWRLLTNVKLRHTCHADLDEIWICEERVCSIAALFTLLNKSWWSMAHLATNITRIQTPIWRTYCNYRGCFLETNLLNRKLKSKLLKECYQSQYFEYSGNIMHLVWFGFLASKHVAF